jgi:hypothetical protein
MKRVSRSDCITLLPNHPYFDLNPNPTFFPPPLPSPSIERKKRWWEFLKLDNLLMQNKSLDIDVRERGN